MIKFAVDLHSRTNQTNQMNILASCGSEEKTEVENVDLGCEDFELKEVCKQPKKILVLKDLECL